MRTTTAMRRRACVEIHDDFAAVSIGDSVNGHFGAIEPVPEGFRFIDDVATTLAGYLGTDPIVLALRTTVARIAQPGQIVSIAASDSTLKFAAAGVELICSLVDPEPAPTQ